MVHSNPTLFGVLALAASASASLDAAGHRRHHARLAATSPSHSQRSHVFGVAYYGYQNSTQNACGTYSSDNDMIIGVGPDYYGNMDIASPQCFQHITVSLKSDPTKSVDVTLTDACEGCGDPGNVYVSPAAFKALSGGSLDAGVLDVVWSFGSFSSSSTSAASSSSTSESSSSDEDDEDCDGEDSSSTLEATAPIITATAVATTEKAATSIVEPVTTSTAQAVTTKTEAAPTKAVTPTPEAATTKAVTHAPAATKAATTTVTTSSNSNTGSTSSGSNGSRASNSDVQTYLQTHNSIRSQYGAVPVTLSNAAAEKAQEWADKCTNQHSGGTLGPLGENLAAGTGSYSIAEAVKDWTDEVSEYNSNNPQPSHFTQVVWKATTQIGCAVQTCDGIFAGFGAAQYYVCEYSVQGNVIGNFGANVQA